MELRKRVCYAIVYSWYILNGYAKTSESCRYRRTPHKMEKNAFAFGTKLALAQEKPVIGMKDIALPFKKNLTKL